MEDKARIWVEIQRDLEELIRRERIDLADPADFKRLAEGLMAHIADQAATRNAPHLPALAPWQEQAIANFCLSFVLAAQSALPKPPSHCLLVDFCVADPDDQTVSRFAIDEAVQVDLFARGRRIRTRPIDIVALGKSLRGVVAVETIGPSRGHIIWVGHWPHDLILFAWDLRALVASASDSQVDELLRRLRGIGGKHKPPSPGWWARHERETVLENMWQEDRLALLRDALVNELQTEQHRKIPLRGLVRAGASTIWDAGSGTGDGYGFLREWSRMLRQQGEELNRAAAADDVHEMEEKLGAPRAEPESPDLLEMIEDRISPLRGREREAVRHYLHARLIHRTDLKAYCLRVGLNYEATSRAARRGWSKTKKK